MRPTIFLLPILAFLLTACGGSGGGSSHGPAPMRPAVTSYTATSSTPTNAPHAEKGPTGSSPVVSTYEHDARISVTFTVQGLPDGFVGRCGLALEVPCYKGAGYSAQFDQFKQVMVGTAQIVNGTATVAITDPEALVSDATMARVIVQDGQTVWYPKVALVPLDFDVPDVPFIGEALIFTAPVLLAPTAPSSKG